MIQAQMQPPKLRIPDEVVTDFVDVVRKTECFEPADIEWVESILTRQDQADGYHQLTSPFIFSRADQGENLYAVCKVYNEQAEKLTPVEKHEARMHLTRLLWSKRISMYRQKKVIVACPQRKQHPKYPTPNVHGWEGAGQHVSTQLLAVYGLDYVQARTQCVKQALTDADATHILFLDDDVLIPKDAARVLMDAQLPSVAGVYCKKTSALQTNATTSGPDAEFVYNQHLVDPEHGNMTPVPASCVGGGMWLIDLNVFRKLTEPWFEMIRNPAGAVVIGEDSLACQKMAANGITTHVIPGLIGVHVDFATGDCYAPAAIVDPATMRIRDEFAGLYQSWPEDLDLKELLAGDIVDFFSKNVELKKKGLIK